MENYEDKIVDLLKKGYSINEICSYLKNKGFKTNSKSSVEKHIYKLKKEYKAKTLFQLGFLMKC